MLLEWDKVNPDKANQWSQIPLPRAVVNKHEGAVKMLLGRNGIDPSNASKQGPAPLSRALKNLYERITERLW